VIADTDALVARARALAESGERTILGLVEPLGGGKSTAARVILEAAGPAAAEDPTRDLKALRAAGIDREGVDALMVPMQKLLDGIETRRRAADHQRRVGRRLGLPGDRAGAATSPCGQARPGCHDRTGLVWRARSMALRRGSFAR
jgi:hypothetical protein